MSVDDRMQGERSGLLARLSAAETVLGALLLLIILVGLMLVGKGLYMKAKAELSQVLLERAFDSRLAGESHVRPWPWADFDTEARIAAPRLGQSAIVLKGASGEALAFGPAWLANTPEPGEPGTAVIAAHRDTHFRWLKDVKPGDLLEVTRADGARLTFRAGEGRVAPWDRSGINAEAIGRHLALATCFPFDATERGPLRYILTAELISETQPDGTIARLDTHGMTDPATTLADAGPVKSF